MKRRMDKKVEWRSMEPQQDQERIVEMQFYYTALKADSSYRKRVSWLESNPQVALYEYVGEPPIDHAVHGLAWVHDRVHPYQVDGDGQYTCGTPASAAIETGIRGARDRW